MNCNYGTLPNVSAHEHRALHNTNKRNNILWLISPIYICCLLCLRLHVCIGLCVTVCGKENVRRWLRAQKKYRIASQYAIHLFFVFPRSRRLHRLRVIIRIASIVAMNRIHLHTQTQCCCCRSVTHVQYVFLHNYMHIQNG